MKTFIELKKSYGLVSGLQSAKTLMRPSHGLGRKGLIGTRVPWWTRKALAGTFMGGLEAEIADGIQIFKPKILKDAISLAMMRDDQLTRKRKLSWPPLPARSPLALPPAACDAPTMSVSPVRRLPWEEMQRREHLASVFIAMIISQPDIDAKNPSCCSWT